MLVASFGAGQDDYTRNGPFHVTIEEILKPITTIQYLTGLTFLEPLIITGTLNMDQELLSNKVNKYLQII